MRDRSASLSLQGIDLPNTQFIRQNSVRLLNETEPAGILPKLRLTPRMRDASAPPIEKLNYWISPITGKNYPTRFEIEIPSLDARFEVSCRPKEQEFVSKMGSLTDVRTLL
jgi:hypothetical protein